MAKDARQAQVVYEIRVVGALDPSWEPYFSHLTITTAASDVAPVTSLTGTVADQPALRGLLCKLWDLNLVLLSVQRLQEVVYDDERTTR